MRALTHARRRQLAEIGTRYECEYEQLERQEEQQTSLYREISQALLHSARVTRQAEYFARVPAQLQLVRSSCYEWRASVERETAVSEATNSAWIGYTAKRENGKIRLHGDRLEFSPDGTSKTKGIPLVPYRLRGSTTGEPTSCDVLAVPTTHGTTVHR